MGKFPEAGMTFIVRDRFRGWVDGRRRLRIGGLKNYLYSVCRPLPSLSLSSLFPFCTPPNLFSRIHPKPSTMPQVSDAAIPQPPHGRETPARDKVEKIRRTSEEIENRVKEVTCKEMEVKERELIVC